VFLYIDGNNVTSTLPRKISNDYYLFQFPEIRVRTAGVYEVYVTDDTGHRSAAYHAACRALSTTTVYVAIE